eukprot:1109432-Rhodomonas_salina.1
MPQHGRQTRCYLDADFGMGHSLTRRSQVVSNPSSEPKERPTQTVQRPFLLVRETLVESDACFDMMFTLFGSCRVRDSRCDDGRQETESRNDCEAGEVFPGKWHIALKCTSDPRHPMRYRMSLRYTTKTHLQTEKAIRITHLVCQSLEPKNNGEDERRQEEQAREKIQNSDLKSLEKLKYGPCTLDPQI